MSDSSNIRVKSTIEGDKGILEVAGRITVSTAPELNRVVSDAFDHGLTDVLNIEQ